MNNDKLFALGRVMAGRTDQRGSPSTEPTVLHGFTQLSSLEDSIYQACVKAI